MRSAAGRLRRARWTSASFLPLNGFHWLAAGSLSLQPFWRHLRVPGPFRSGRPEIRRARVCSEPLSTPPMGVGTDRAVWWSVGAWSGHARDENPLSHLFCLSRMQSSQADPLTSTPTRACRPQPNDAAAEWGVWSHPPQEEDRPNHSGSITAARHSDRGASRAGAR
jgi:hypothetical protein